jgi:hypothetical protein
MTLVGFLSHSERVQAQSDRVTVNPKDRLGDTLNTFGHEYKKQNATFRETQTAGTLLIGFALNLASKGANDSQIIGMIPIYRKNTEEIYGTSNGNLVSRSHILVAKDGYAVGGLQVRSALHFIAMKVVFMKVVGDHLDVNDSYTSALVGVDGDSWRKEISTGGNLPVGVWGSVDNKQLLRDFGMVVKMKEEEKPKKKK